MLVVAFRGGLVNLYRLDIGVLQDGIHKMENELMIMKQMNLNPVSLKSYISNLFSSAGHEGQPSFLFQLENLSFLYLHSQSVKLFSLSSNCLIHQTTIPELVASEDRV
jgi:hypothetical protein